MPLFRQESFAGGEIAPSLWGRSGVDKYQTALASCRNLLPIKHGAAQTRPGTKYMECLGLTVEAGGQPHRLIPFVLSNTVAYVLAFSEYMYEVVKNGTVIHVNWAPYPAAALSKLKFAQLGRVMTICHPDFYPYELTCYDDTNWEILPLYTAPPAALFGSGFPASLPAIERSSALVTQYPQGAVPISPTLFTNNDYIQTLREGIARTLEGGLFSFGPNISTPVYVDLLPARQNHTNWDYDTTHHPQPWRYFITSIVKHSDGSVRESAAYPITKSRQFGALLYSPTTHYALGARVSTDRWTGAYYVSIKDDPGDPNIGKLGGADWATWWSPVAAPVNPCDRGILGTYDLPDTLIVASNLPVTISWNLDAWTYPAGLDWRFVGWKIYRGLKGQDAGLVGYTDAATTDPGGSWSFTDFGDAPDYSLPPPQGYDPFVIKSLSGSTLGWEHPTVVTFFDQRRIFAAPAPAKNSDGMQESNGRPGWIIGSCVGDYSNFDRAVIQTANQEVEFELAAQYFEEIRALLPVSKLLAFTSNSEWSISGSGGALAFDNVDAKVQGNHGISRLDPLLVGNEALYVQERGPRIQSLLFDFASQSWDGAELSVFSDHLIEGHAIVSWTWAQQPFRAVFLVRDDGVLLSMTYLRDQKVVAWARHDTVGKVLDVCAVPEGNFDAVYLLVARGKQVILERMLDPATSGAIYSQMALDCQRSHVYATAPFTASTGMGTVSDGSLATLTFGGTLPLWPEEAGYQEVWNPNLTYTGSSTPTDIRDVVLFGTTTCWEAIANSKNSIPQNGSVAWAQVARWDSGRTYAAGELCAVVGTFHDAVFQSRVSGNIGVSPVGHPDQWAGVRIGVRNPLVLRAMKPDGSTVTFTISARPEDGTDISWDHNTLTVRVSGQTTAPVADGTSFTSWTRTTTAIDSLLFISRTSDISGQAVKGPLATVEIFSPTADTSKTELASSGDLTGPSNPIASLYPAAAQISSPDGIVAAVFGFGFTQELAQLPPVHEKQEIRTVLRALSKMSVELRGWGTVQIGQDLDHLQTLAIPASKTAPLDLSEALVEGRPRNRWVKGAIGVIRQESPYPMRISSITRDLEFGETG